MRVDLHNINVFENDIANMALDLLDMKHQWLVDNGWSVTREHEFPPIYTYSKANQILSCADEAITKELES